MIEALFTVLGGMEGGKFYGRYGYGYTGREREGRSGQPGMQMQKA